MQLSSYQMQAQGTQELTVKIQLHLAFEALHFLPNKPVQELSM
jgi:hypothetical protein